ncbi:MAG: glycosyltransferase family 4 protein, partial [Vicinamibacteria bacterium]
MPPGEHRIRLLFVLPSEVRGGAEEVVLSLLRGLDPAGYEIALACPGSLLKAFGRDLASLDVRTLAVRPSSWAYPRDLWRLASFIREFRPHVINTHLFRATLVAAPIAKALGVPLVIETYHGREAWRKGWIKGGFWIDRLVSRFVDRIIAVSRAARDFLVEVKSIPGEKITVVPNGRELSYFTPGAHVGDLEHELRLSPDAPVLGVIGRLEPQKGHHHLLDAMPEVLSKVPAAVLLVVGEGSLKEVLTLRSIELGVEKQVRFLGYRKDVARIMDGVDLVVMPSLYEGLPLIAIEAAAMGKPIVASRVDGAEEVVIDGETGVLIPPADPGRLAAAIVELLKDSTRTNEMGPRARA